MKLLHEAYQERVSRRLPLFKVLQRHIAVQPAGAADLESVCKQPDLNMRASSEWTVIPMGHGVHESLAHGVSGILGDVFPEQAVNQATRSDVAHDVTLGRIHHARHRAYELLV